MHAPPPQGPVPEVLRSVVRSYFQEAKGGRKSLVLGKKYGIPKQFRSDPFLEVSSMHMIYRSFDFINL